MACEYCKNKAKNKPIISSGFDDDQGGTVEIETRKRDGAVVLTAHGWYDGGYGSVYFGQTKINYCPNCGAKVVEGC